MNRERKDFVQKKINFKPIKNRLPPSQFDRVPDLQRTLVSFLDAFHLRRDYPSFHRVYRLNCYHLTRSLALTQNNTPGGYAN